MSEQAVSGDPATPPAPTVQLPTAVAQRLAQLELSVHAREAGVRSEMVGDVVQLLAAQAEVNHAGDVIVSGLPAKNAVEAFLLRRPVFLDPKAPAPRPTQAAAPEPATNRQPAAESAFDPNSEQGKQLMIDNPAVFSEEMRKYRAQLMAQKGRLYYHHNEPVRRMAR